MKKVSIKSMSNSLQEKKKKGFTLVELIIVIAIIAILAAIAIPKFGQVTRNANIKADIASAKNLHGIAAQLIAEGELKAGSDKAVIETAVKTKLDGGEIPKTKLDNTKSFVVEIGATADITVTNGTDKVYPIGSGAYVAASTAGN